MSKRFRGALAVLVAVAMAGILAWPAVMGAQGIRSGAGAYYYFFQAVNENDDPFTTEGAVRCSVYSRGNGDNATIVHTTAQLTTAYTLPLASNSNGIVHWYSATNVPFNVKCFTQYGDYAYKNSFAITNHKLKIDTTGAYKISRFPYVTSASPTGTGIVIPAGGQITDVAVEKVTGAAATAHLNVGFSGNHAVATRNALVAALNVNNPGFVMIHAGGAIGAATDTNRGLALTHVMSQQVNGAPDLRFAKAYLVHVNSGLEVTFDTSSGAGIGGHVYIFWRMLHVGANGWGSR